MQQHQGLAPKRPKARGKSSTIDILGLPTRNGKPSLKWAEHYKTLTTLRDRLCGNKSARTENARVEISLAGEHMADSATDSYDRDWALAMVSSDQNALYEIDEALSRICQGTYGFCELTGKRIDSARLKAIPWTRFCARAQADLEARGLSSRTQLGDVGTWSSSAESETLAGEELEEVGSKKTTDQT